MIFTLIFGMFVTIFAVIFQYFPIVTELPFGSDAILSTGMGYIHFVIAVFPPLGIMLSGFLVIIGFKMLMLVLRAVPIIGRMVGAHNSGYSGR